MSHKARIRSGHVYVINVVQLSIQIEINRKQLIYICNRYQRELFQVSRKIVFQISS